MTQVRIWVDPKFKKKLKKIAANQEVTILDLTKEMGEESDDMMQSFYQKKKRKQFDFKF